MILIVASIITFYVMSFSCNVYLIDSSQWSDDLCVFIWMDACTGKLFLITRFYSKAVKREIQSKLKIQCDKLFSLEELQPVQIDFFALKRVHNCNRKIFSHISVVKVNQLIAVHGRFYLTKNIYACITIKVLVLWFDDGSFYRFVCIFTE